MFGKIIITETELRKLQKTFNGLRSKEIELKNKSGEQPVERSMVSIKSRKQHVITTSRDVKKNTVCKDILKYDYGLNGISQQEMLV
ncbi:hypothetical protein [Vagococcus lutrae]|uniref:hypothetical protein n=1 Tax=Vagococcus lutrae TaxID=81947 RepID=UPI00041897B5|nr:hypothetical protein [Vagococcus lutrae]